MKRLPILAGAGVIIATCLTATMKGQVANDPTRVTAWSVNLGHGAEAMMNIQVDRWSTTRERDALVEAFVQGQQIGLFDTLQHVPVKGRMWIPSRRTVNWTLQYAWQETRPDGGRRVVVVANRHIALRHIPTASLRAEFPFAFIEVQVNAGGTGDGRMVEQAKLTVDHSRNLLLLENYAAEPVRLLNVKIEKTS